MTDRLCWINDPEGEVFLTEDGTNLERMHVCLSEVGLEPTDGGGGWWGWDRALTQEEYDLVVKAENIAGKSLEWFAQPTEEGGKTDD